MPDLKSELTRYQAALKDQVKGQEYKFFPEAGLYVGVTVERKRPSSVKGDNLPPAPKGADAAFMPTIDRKTGIINLPREATYAGLQGKGGVFRRVPVSSVSIEILKDKKDTNVVVLCRHDGKEYHDAMQKVGDVSTGTIDYECFQFPPFNVRWTQRREEEMAALGRGPLAVWCQTNQSSRLASRADVFRVGDTDDPNVVTLSTIFVITWDDGEILRVIEDIGGEWDVYRRKTPAPYQVVSDDRHVRGVVETFPDVAEFLRDYVLVPKLGYGNFELKIHALKHPGLRAMLKAAAHQVEPWDGDEDFWIHPPMRVGLGPDLGMVKFHRYGMNDASMGAVLLPQKVEVGGRMVDEVQIRHGSIDADEDEQGLKIVRPGDIVQIDRLVCMDYQPDQGDKKEYPPLAYVSVLYRYREVDRSAVAA